MALLLALVAVESAHKINNWNYYYYYYYSGILRIPSRSIRNYCTFTVHHNFKAIPLQDVFLLPMQSVRTLTSLTKTIFCLCILDSLLLVFTSFCIYLFFSFLRILCFVLACNQLSCCCQAGNNWIELLSLLVLLLLTGKCEDNKSLQTQISSSFISQWHPNLRSLKTHDFKILM
jgi:hypothetical protein